MVFKVGDGAMFMIESGCRVDLIRDSFAAEGIRPITGSDMTHEPGLEDCVRFPVGPDSELSNSPATICLELSSRLPDPAVHYAVEAGPTAAGRRLVDVTNTVRGLRRVKSSVGIPMVGNAQKAMSGTNP